MELPKRKCTRLKGYDYNTPGVYFITICTIERKAILSKIRVGTGVLDGPKNELSAYGKTADAYIRQMSAHYACLTVDKYVIMPNHIHLLLRVYERDGNGPSRTPVPTNSIIAKFISTLKRFCNKDYGENIWQARSHDHIVRSETDYRIIWEYIDNNVAKWKEDCFYTA